MTTAKINRKMLRKAMAAKDIFTFTELARRAKCSVTTVHLAIERPSRFSPAVSRIKRILNLADLSTITNGTITNERENSNV